MRRRDFDKLIWCAAASALPAYGEDRPAVRRLGVFLGLTAGPDDPAGREILNPLKAALKDAGWIEGGNLHLDLKFGGGDRRKIDIGADELVALEPEVIYATGLPPVQALRQRTRKIPIVFSLVADPVGVGLVDSLARPGGNVTGFVVWDLSIGGKWMQFLQELVPTLRQIGFLYNPDTAPYAPSLIASARRAASRDANVIECHTRNEKEVEAVASSLASSAHSGLIVIPEPFTNANRDKIIAQCERFRIPTLNPIFSAVDRGALMSYTFEFVTMMREPAAYIDRILRGESPSNLPIQAPTNYVLSINLKAAKALGLTVPLTILARADRIVE